MSKRTATQTVIVEAPVVEVTRGRGRPPKYFSDEERAQGKRDAVKRYNEKKAKHNETTVSAILATLAGIETKRLNAAQKSAIAETTSLVSTLKV